MLTKLNKLNYSARTDVANICLMAASCWLATKLPFALFLFSYAILGPLHYLTEIFWLKKNSYYLPGKNNYVWLVLICLVILLLWAFSRLILKTPGQTSFTGYLINVLVLFAFFCSVIFTVITNARLRLVSFLLFIALSFFLWRWPAYLLLFGLLLNTIIHVCVFTWIFMFLGAVRSNGITGYTVIILYVICLTFLAFVPIDLTTFSFSEYEKSSFLSSGFQRLNRNISNIFGMHTLSVFTSEAGLRIQMLLAFTYTYHYLNWFSKVEIIKWHQVKRTEKIVTVTLWIFSVVLYVYNYRTGLIALFFLSLLHVILEFPLNVKSIAAIGPSLKKLFRVR